MFLWQKNFFSEVIRVLLCDVTFREISTEFFTLSSGKDKTYFFKQKKCMWRFVFPWKLKLYFFLGKTQENYLRYEKVDTRQWHGQWLTKYFAAKFSPFKIFMMKPKQHTGVDRTRM